MSSFNLYRVFKSIAIGRCNYQRCYKGRLSISIEFSNQLQFYPNDPCDSDMYSLSISIEFSNQLQYLYGNDLILLTGSFNLYRVFKSIAMNIPASVLRACDTTFNLYRVFKSIAIEIGGGVSVFDPKLSISIEFSNQLQFFERNSFSCLHFAFNLYRVFKSIAIKKLGLWIDEI